MKFLILIFLYSLNSFSLHSIPIEKLLPSGKYRATSFVVAMPSQTNDIQSRFAKSMAANQEWFQKYAAKAKGPLPYHPKFGITKKEYETLNQAFKKFSTVDQESFDLEIKNQNGKITFVTAKIPALGENIISISASQISSHGLLAPLKYQENLKAVFGQWSGYHWSVVEGDPSSGESKAFDGGFGRLNGTGRLFMNVRFRVMHQGKITLNDDKSFWLTKTPD